MKASQVIAKITLLFAALTFVQTSEAQEVKLQGQMFKNYDVIDDVHISIYQSDSLIAQTESNGSGKFKLKLKGNTDYELVFTKKNYLSKTIKVKNLKESGYDKSKSLSFKFDVELEKAKAFRYVDTSELNEPVAYIFYNADKDKLDWDRDHTFQVHEQIAELKDLNDEKRREKYRSF